MSGFAIRPMQAADLDAVVAIAAGAAEAPQWPWSAFATYLGPDPENPSLVRVGLVAENRESGSGAIVGFACAALLRIPADGGTENLCQLDSIAVRGEVRRRGIGAALLRALLGWAGENGAQHFSLEVRPSNQPAMAMYRRLGFAVEGRRPGYYADPQEDALLLGTSVTVGTPGT